MKASLILIAALFAGSVSAQSLADFKALFWKQLASTCADSLHWEKSVADLSEADPSPTQRIDYHIDCHTGQVRHQGQASNLPWEEFNHLFEHDFDNPYLSPMLDVQRGEQGVLAKPKAGEAEKTPLQLLRFSLVDGRIQEAEVKIHKDNPLYELKVHVLVHFNAAGQYAGHEIDTFSDILLGGQVTTHIEGRLLP